MARKQVPLESLPFCIGTHCYGQNRANSHMDLCSTCYRLYIIQLKAEGKRCGYVDNHGACKKWPDYALGDRCKMHARLENVEFLLETGEHPANIARRCGFPNVGALRAAMAHFGIVITTKEEEEAYA